MGRRKRHTAEEIAGILKQQEAGLKVSDICRKHGISEQTFFR
jgi:putative transposase